MADDIQQSNLLLGLGAQGRISETTSLSQVGNGINLEKEAKQMESDADAVRRILEAKQKLQTLVQAYVNKLSTLEGIDTQIEGQMEQNNAGNMAQTSMANNIVNGAIMQTTDGLVNKINALKTPQEKQAVLLQLQRESPAQYNKVIGAMNGMPQDDPLPTVRPPRSGPEKAKV
jgi:beta-glucosidase-like glycosyl hydrolase